MPKILLRRLRDGDGLIPARTLLQIEGQVGTGKGTESGAADLGQTQRPPRQREPSLFMCVSKDGKGEEEPACYSSRRPSRARMRVASSAYSRWLPTGMP